MNVPCSWDALEGPVATRRIRQCAVRSSVKGHADRRFGERPCLLRQGFLCADIGRLQGSGVDRKRMVVSDAHRMVQMCRVRRFLAENNNRLCKSTNCPDAADVVMRQIRKHDLAADRMGFRRECMDPLYTSCPYHRTPADDRLVDAVQQCRRDRPRSNSDEETSVIRHTLDAGIRKLSSLKATAAYTDARR